MTDPEHIAALQRALAFWLPCVPNEDNQRADRIAEDSYLLMGYQGESECEAEQLGWISLPELKL